MTDDIQLLRELNNMNLQSVIWKLDKKIDLAVLAKATYHKIGVFIDLRCQFTENVRVALKEVRKNCVLRTEISINYYSQLFFLISGSK